jgi:hypothetical protein
MTFQNLNPRIFKIDLNLIIFNQNLIKILYELYVNLINYN